jgi:hypothetical protein
MKSIQEDDRLSAVEMAMLDEIIRDSPKYKTWQDHLCAIVRARFALQRV